MKKHPIIILLVVLSVVGIIIYIIATGNKTSTTTSSPVSGPAAGAVVFPILRAANDPSTLPVAVRTVNGRPIIL